MTLREILEELGEDYYPYHEYGDQYVPDNIKTLDKYESQIKAWIEENVIKADLPLEQPGDEKLSTIDRAVWVTFRKGANWVKQSQRQQLREEK